MNRYKDEWDEENERRDQEKHDELFWSEIEDGIAPKTPRHIGFGKRPEQSAEDKAKIEKLRNDIKALQERLRIR